jgi:hypothetical protein
MRVLCVDAGQLKRPLLKEGEVYAVYEENTWYFNMPVFFLTEIDCNGKKHPFAQDRFIPLSDIDETELVNELETEKQLA